jgi:hypothetical protein
MVTFFNHGTFWFQAVADTQRIVNMLGLFPLGTLKNAILTTYCALLGFPLFLIASFSSRRAQRVQLAQELGLFSAFLRLHLHTF